MVRSEVDFRLAEGAPRVELVSPGILAKVIHDSQLQARVLDDEVRVDILLGDRALVV